MQYRLSNLFCIHATSYIRSWTKQQQDHVIPSDVFGPFEVVSLVEASHILTCIFKWSRFAKRVHDPESLSSCSKLWGVGTIAGKCDIRLLWRATTQTRGKAICHWEKEYERMKSIAFHSKYTAVKPMGSEVWSHTVRQDYCALLCLALW